jgi:acyl dehydratase
MTSDMRIVVGDAFACGVHVFTAEKIKRFAAAYDPQPFHTDEAAAAESHFGALCASGWHTAAIMMRYFVRHFAGEIERTGESGESAPQLGPLLGVDDLKWLKPVYAGDEIAFSGRIVARRESRSRPGWEIVSFDTTGINQHGEPVFACIGHIMVAMIEDR